MIQFIPDVSNPIAIGLYASAAAAAALGLGSLVLVLRRSRRAKRSAQADSRIAEVISEREKQRVLDLSRLAVSLRQGNGQQRGGVLKESENGGRKRSSQKFSGALDRSRDADNALITSHMLMSDNTSRSSNAPVSRSSFDDLCSTSSYSGGSSSSSSDSGSCSDSGGGGSSGD